MLDRRIIESMKAVLSRLSAPVSMVEPSQLDADTADFISILPDSTLGSRDGRLYIKVRRQPLFLSCGKETPKDVLILAEALIATMIAPPWQISGRSDVIRMALLGELTGPELQAHRNRFHIPPKLNHCVLIVRITGKTNEKAYDLIRNIIPLSDGDTLLDFDHSSAVLLKNTSDIELSDLHEYADALHETLTEEIAQQILIGIGTSRYTLSDMRESYLEAEKSLEIYKLFRPEKKTCAYDQLILQRILMEMHPDRYKYYQSLLFNRSTARLFNDEMLYTIDMFFRKDLNMSDTARQLYVHRNTLVYRLDKVQKQTGLDLRHFDDAVTFRILLEMKKALAPQGQKEPLT